MKLVIVCILILCLTIVRVQGTDPEFPHECYNRDYLNLYLEYTCKLDGKSQSSQCLDQVYYNQTNVEVIKYLCENKLNSLNLNPDIFDKFKNVRILDTSSLGINYATFIRGGSTYVSENKVSRWKITHNKLTQIPISMLDCMPKLSEIEFQYNEIRILDFRNLKKANDILMVNCSHNHIWSIDAGAFSTLTKLEILDLSHNNIYQIDQVDFEYNKNLKVLCLSANPLGKFTSKLMSSLHNLEILDVSNTSIVTSNDGFFENNPHLKKLNLKGTPLEKFSFNTFSSQANAVQVCLPSNNIKELDISCVDTICHFKQFCEGDFFKNIRSFKAAGIRDQNISKLLEKMGSDLEMLDLTWNSIATLTDDMLQQFPNLLHLKLSHSNISKIENNAFLWQTKLNLLDLSNNHLKSIDNVIFAFHWKLQHLFLNGNQLTTLSKITSYNLQKLEFLDISGNSFDPVYLEEFLKSWKYNRLKINTKMTSSPATLVTMTEAGRTTITPSTDLPPTFTSPTQEKDLTPTSAATTQINESDISKSNLSIKLDISTNTMYVIVGVVLIVITIIVVAVVLYFCRRQPVTPATIHYSTVSANTGTNVTTLAEEGLYEEIKEPMPTAYAVGTLLHLPQYENVPTRTTTIDRYQNDNNSSNVDEYATVYHHYATISKPKSIPDS